MSARSATARPRRRPKSGVGGRGFSPASIAVVVSLLLIPAGHAQQPAPQRAPGAVSAGVNAVLMDVVVRDRRGQPVRDLKPSDFQVFEDRVPQTIGSFTPVFEGEAAV